MCMRKKCSKDEGIKVNGREPQNKCGNNKSDVKVVPEKKKSK